MTPFPHFSYQNQKLFCEGCDVDLIAQKQGSPLYVYSYAAMTASYSALSAAFAQGDHLICYAVKANSNQAILKTFFNLGAGADVVSGGEMRRALNAGCEPQKIVFSGVGKTSEEIHFAIEQGILQFNVECEQELLNIQRIAKFLDRKAPVAIRVNPDVDAKSHPHISTGLKTDKFGVDFEHALALYRQAKTLSHIDVVGLHCHIGSQITELSPYREAFAKIRTLVLQLKSEGIELKQIDAGGGFAIAYNDEKIPSAAEYAQVFWEAFADLNVKLIVEPGRYLVGNAGILVTKVLYGKTNSVGQVYSIVDAGMADLIRPMLYGAQHQIWSVVKNPERKTIKMHISGPYCESTDILGKDRMLTIPAAGEYLAVMSAGAYGLSMASWYNSRGRPGEVLVNDKMFYIIKKPDRLDDFTKQESLPEFLKI